MALSELLASGTTAANSADVTLVDGAATTVIQRGRGAALIQVKDTAGGYVTVGQIDDQTPARIVNGPCVFRVRREGTAGTALAVDRDA